MSLNSTNLHGTDAKIVYFQDGAKKTLDAKTWSIKPNVTKNAEGVNGETRDRLSKILNYWEITISCYQRDLELLDAYLADQANEDTGAAPLDKQGGFRLVPRTSNRRSFIISDIVWDDIEQNMGGRADAVMVTVNMRASDVKATTSI